VLESCKFNQLGLLLSLLEIVQTTRSSSRQYWISLLVADCINFQTKDENKVKTTEKFKPSSTEVTRYFSEEEGLKEISKKREEEKISVN